MQSSEVSDAFLKTLDHVKNDNAMEDIVRETVVDTLKGIFDPEISINIYDLGLIYDLKIDENGKLYVLMTFTSAWCPFADELLKQVKTLTLECHDKINEVEVITTMLPQWGKDKINEEYRDFVAF
tara:strand:- start:11851 stop:12225 length:375 start_codon:yes stop_codon:yes gene_type:complete